MNILIVHSYFHELGDLNKPAGGIETHTAGLYKALTLLGHDVTIAATKDSKLQKDIKFLPIDNNCKDASEGRYSQVLGYEKVTQEILDGEFDVVLNNNPSISAMKIIDTACQFAGIKHFYFIHQVIEGISAKSAIDALNRSQAELIAVSSYVASQVRSQGYTAGRIKVVNSTFAEPVESIVPFRYEKQAVMCCRVVKIREVLLAVKTFGELLPDWNLIVIGEGVNHPAEIPYFNQVKEEAEKYENVDLAGRLNQDQAHCIIDQSSVFLNLCHFEAFGLAAFEAQKLGIPVVHFYKGVKSGVSDFIRDEGRYPNTDTGVAVNVSGLRETARKNELKEAILKATMLDKGYIKKHFSKYSLKSFADELMRIIGS